MNELFSPLSEAELTALIEETERCGSVAPPPELEEAIWQRVETAERRARLSPCRKKRTPAEELRRYRFQVAATVAAAVWLLFTAPAWNTLFPDLSDRDVSPALENPVPKIEFDIFEIIGGRQ